MLWEKIQKQILGNCTINRFSLITFKIIKVWNVQESYFSLDIQNKLLLYSASTLFA